MNNWRVLPTVLKVFLVDTLKYVMFVDENGDFVMTVKGQIDNNEGASITVDNIDRVARGFFWQDASFGFNSLDGFVVFYVQETQRWYSKSLLLEKGKYSLFEKNVDLTHYPSNWKWGCEVTPGLEFDELACTRILPDQADFDIGQIRYEN